MKILREVSQSIWLIDAVDKVGIQKINIIPNIDPLQQVGKICTALGMQKIRLEATSIAIGSIDIIGCMVSCAGYDIVPFVSGVFPDEKLSKSEFDLSERYGISKKESDDYN